MSNCDSGQVWCPTERRRFAELGSHDSGGWEHNTKQKITLGGIQIFSSERVAGSSWNSGTNYEDSFACVTVIGTELFAYHKINSVENEPNFVTFKDKNTIIENEIYFLDLRHDILVRKETTYTYDCDEISNDTTLWNQYGNVSRIHKIRPKDIELTTNTKLYVNDKLIDSSVDKSIRQNPYTFTMPPSVGIPQANTQTEGVEDEYYIWVERKDEDGGYDLYYPEWVRGLGVLAERFELTNRDTHRSLNGIVPYDRLPYKGEVGVSNIFIHTETDNKGSWAVSTTTATEEGNDNLMAFETKKLKTGYEKSLLPSDDKTEELFGNPSGSVWPISPL